MTAFEEMGVLPEIARAIEDEEWTLPTDVQAEAIPLILGGGDVLMAAETGSGKTGAFCLPILQTVWETSKNAISGKTPGKTLDRRISSPKWVLDPIDRSHAMAVAADGLRCQSREQREWHGCRANKGVHGTGKYYYEASVIDEGLCRIGWSTKQACLDLGTDKFGYGFGSTGKKSNAKQFENYGESFTMGDTIGALLDLNRGEISFTKNGVHFGLAFNLNNQQKEQTYFPAVVLKNAEMSFNFGDQKFKYCPPGDHVAISTVARNLTEDNFNTERSYADDVANEKGAHSNTPQAIIIEPSRELAEQTYNQLNKFKKYITDPIINLLLVVGGVPVKEQIAALNAGVDIVVGTPGRLEDLIQGNYLSLKRTRFFVLDEADGLLKQGYSNFIDRLHRQMPKAMSDGKRLQMVVCSATCHDFDVKKMADRLMHFPTWVDLKGEDVVPETVHHVVAMVDPQDDKSWRNLQYHIETDSVHRYDSCCRPGYETAETWSEAVKILKGEYCVRAIREHKMDRAIIFCRTKVDCDNLEKYFKHIDGNNSSQFSCVCLHGDRKPQERKANLEKFKQQVVKFLICTDVAARGLDITGLPFMINITLPDDKSNYVHRIGRVGRAERMGLAISLVSSVPEKVWYHGEWCSSRGRNCNNTNLTNQGGCCIWYNEMQYLADIEDHLNVTIQQVGPDIKVPTNEFDGKVVYGQKRVNNSSNYQNHVQQMAPVVATLAGLESRAQLTYIKRHLVTTV